MDLKLANFTGNGTLIIKCEDISFEMSVVKDFSTKTVKAAIKYLGTNHSGQYEMPIRIFPANGYMQLLVNQVSNKLYANLQLGCLGLTLF